MVICGTCTRCNISGNDDVLKQIMLSDKRSLEDILGRAQNRNTPVTNALEKQRAERLDKSQQQLDLKELEFEQLEEDLSYVAFDEMLRGESVDLVVGVILDDDRRQHLIEDINTLKWQPADLTPDDVRNALLTFERNGLINIKKNRVELTSRGARRLAVRSLELILARLYTPTIGSRPTEETGFGSVSSLLTRSYEIGDDYAAIDIEKTLISSLRRRGTLLFDLPDLEVQRKIHESKLTVGLLIDKSSSMKNEGKLKAALEVGLALSALIGKNTREKLRIFVFSETVKEIPVWDIPGAMEGGGATDIQVGMRALRRSLRFEDGEKQAYLITDTEPNTVDGHYVGFEVAARGLMKEALLYRRDGIGLNIIMLDQKPNLKKFSRLLAEKNAGRVIFTNPKELGRLLVEDYLVRKHQV